MSFYIEPRRITHKFAILLFVLALVSFVLGILFIVFYSPKPAAQFNVPGKSVVKIEKSGDYEILEERHVYKFKKEKLFLGSRSDITCNATNSQDGSQVNLKQLPGNRGVSSCRNGTSCAIRMHQWDATLSSGEYVFDCIISGKNESLMSVQPIVRIFGIGLSGAVPILLLIGVVVALILSSIGTIFVSNKFETK